LGVPVIVIEPGSFKSRNRASTEAAAEADRAGMGKNAARRYGQAMDAFMQFSRKAFMQFSRKVEANAGDPERVAAVVERALTTRRPRARYLVGSDARLVVTSSRLLPTRTMDALLSKTIGLPRQAPAEVG
jgi:NAD(P)-dependent dehydrogenase (short-subunit alcohol dehydrogenase family)